MEELQNDSASEELSTPAEAENPETGAALAPASEGQHEENNPADDEAAKQEAAKQEAINKRINEKHFQAKQAERERDEARQKLGQLEQADRDRKAAALRDIPAVPDSFDDNFDQLMQNRDDAIRAQTEFNASQAAFAQQQQLQQQQQQAQQQQNIQQSQISYNSRAAQLGISQQELQAAGSAVGNYGLSDELALHILADKDGPLIVKHLAANPTDGIELSTLSPYSVGSFLADVKQKAAALKPRTSTAPAPVDNLGGQAVTPDHNKYPFIKGAKFE